MLSTNYQRQRELGDIEKQRRRVNGESKITEQYPGIKKKILGLVSSFVEIYPVRNMIGETHHRIH